MVILAVNGLTRATLLLAVVLAAGAFILWLVKRLRGSEVGGALEANDSLTKFRELHARGGLSDEEYRTIKTKLAAELDSELDAVGSGDQTTGAEPNAAELGDSVASKLGDQQVE